MKSMTTNPKRKKCFSGLLCGVLLMIGLSGTSLAGGAQWTQRVIPLPKEIEVSGSFTANREGIAYRLPEGLDPVLAPTISALLEDFANEEKEGSNHELLILLRFARDGETGGKTQRLATLPNADQAYAIETKGDGSARIMTLGANTSIGLLYATRTLHQLLAAPPRAEVPADGQLEIPLMDILDWPDIAQRGEWSPRGYPSLEWYSQWKLNMYRVRLVTWGNSAGRVVQSVWRNIERPEDFFQWGWSMGHTLIPYKDHLAHSSAREWRNVSPPDLTEEELEERARPHLVGFDWSHPAINKLLKAQMRMMAEAVEGRSNEIEVWLSEHRGAPAEEFLDEVRAVHRAREALRADFPDLEVRVLLSQGSEDAGANEEILKMAAEKGLGVAHYSAFTTYVTDREPMVPAAMEHFAAEGGFLDIMPQLDPNIRIHFPGSMPAFIQFRMREFVAKGVRSVTGYLGADRFSYELNMVAFAEFSWNSNGRSPREFAEAYATITGAADPVLFGEWAVFNGEAVWTLMSLTRKSQRHNDILVQLARGNYDLRPPADPACFREGLENARRALHLALESGNDLMLAESTAIYAAFRYLEFYYKIRDSLAAEEDNGSLAPDLAGLAECAGILRLSLYAWDDLVTRNKREQLESVDMEMFSLQPEFMRELGEGGVHPARLKAIAQSFLSGFDWLLEKSRARLSDGDKSSLVPHLPIALKKAGSDDFDVNRRIRLDLDVTEIAPPHGGTYILDFNFPRRNQYRVHAIAPALLDTQTGERTNFRVKGFPRLLQSRGGTPGYDQTVVFPPREAGQALHLLVDAVETNNQGEPILQISLRPVPTPDVADGAKSLLSTHPAPKPAPGEDPEPDADEKPVAPPEVPTE